MATAATETTETGEPTVIFECPLCCVCGIQSVIVLNAAKFSAWKSGAHVQDVWPDMPASWREVLVSGVHSDCWHELFRD